MARRLLGPDNATYMFDQDGLSDSQLDQVRQKQRNISRNHSLPESEHFELNVSGHTDVFHSADCALQTFMLALAQKPLAFIWLLSKAHTLLQSFSFEWLHRELVPLSGPPNGLPTPKLKKPGDIISSPSERSHAVILISSLCVCAGLFCQKASLSFVPSILSVFHTHTHNISTQHACIHAHTHRHMSSQSSKVRQQLFPARFLRTGPSHW